MLLSAADPMPNETGNSAATSDYATDRQLRMEMAARP